MSDAQNPIVLPKGGDKTLGTRYIVEHPEEFGYTWNYGKLGRGVGKNYVEYAKDFPWIDVKPEQVLLFFASFGPGLISDSLGGTSIKVSTDRVNRNEYDKNNAVTDLELKTALVDSVLLKIITRGGGTVTKFVDAKGNEYRSKADLEKAQANAAKIEALESAQAFLAMAADNNIDPVMAREFAKTNWPLAFEKAEDTK